MNTTMTIQDANVIRLREINPERVYAEAVGIEARQACDTDFLHGKAVVSIWPEGHPYLDAVCMACAVPVIEGWLTLDVCDYVTVRVLA
jgi:hypothetical protein